MVPTLSESSDVNVLISNANWAWPQAVERIFQPRGVNALMAETGGDMLELVDQNKIHLAILDMGLDEFSGLQTLRMIRQHNEQLPCILLAKKINKKLLAAALDLRAFSVIGKPVDLNLLAGQIDRLFLKFYASDLFSEFPEPKPSKQSATKRSTTVIKWSFRKK
jgi:DNA-binding response OmpR family regulator